jgi:hypothetical protein
MSALDLIATAQDAEFHSRVAMISFKVAQNVASENPATEHHVERLEYALRTIRGGENPVTLSQHVISSNPTIIATIEGNPALKGSNVPDGDIEFALASIWDARSLAFAGTGGTSVAPLSQFVSPAPTAPPAP